MRSTSMFWVFLATVLMIAPCYGAAPQPPAGFTLYDNFDSKMINPDLWVSQQIEADTAHRVLRESVAELAKNQARLAGRAWACTDCGDSGTLNARVRLRAEGALSNATAMQASVTVNQMSVVGGDVNTSASMARFRLMGFFFNDGQGVPADNDQTGDVFAWVGLRRYSDSTDAPGLLTIVGTVGLCSNNTCSSAATTEKELGTVKTGPKTTLYLEWDQTGEKFIFKWVNGKKTVTAETTYTEAGVTNNAARVYAYNPLEVQVTVPNDTGATGDRAMAFMEAFVDDVYYK
jgi:hypothetical protein